MRFRAKVLNAAMAVERIDVDAADENEAMVVLRNSGARVLDLRVEKHLALLPRRNLTFNLFVFNQQLHALLDAGQTTVDAIEVLGQKDRKARNRSVYDTLIRSLKEGNQLSLAMAQLPSVFPVLYVAMVRSSETTGTVRMAIKRFMGYQAQVSEIRRKLIGAAIYPLILLCVGFLVIAFLMLHVLPQFSEVFESAAMRNNKASGFIELWGTFVRDHTAVAWSSTFGLFVMVMMLGANARFRSAMGRRILKAPVIGEVVWTVHLSRMYRTLGMLLSSGVSVIAAMKMTREVLPASMQSSVDSAVRLVSEGQPISQVMSSQGLSTEIAQRLLVAGESSGRLDEMMGRIADFYDDEMRLWIDTASRVIEPVMMVGLGLVIGAIVLMLYAPIFDLANAF